MCLGIQQGLMSVQFYVDLWWNVCPGVYGAGRWEQYDNAMTEVGRLVFVEKAQENEAELYVNSHRDATKLNHSQYTSFHDAIRAAHLTSLLTDLKIIADL